MPSTAELTEVTDTAVDMSPTACVARGAAVLPTDWFMIVNPDTVDVASTRDCPLAQVFDFQCPLGGYEYGLTLLDLWGGGAGRMGFWAERAEDYPPLTAAWVAEILRLRAVAA